jgi:hypothetical protein
LFGRLPRNGQKREQRGGNQSAKVHEGCALRYTSATARIGDASASIL